MSEKSVSSDMEAPLEITEQNESRTGDFRGYEGLRLTRFTVGGVNFAFNHVSTLFVVIILSGLMTYSALGGAQAATDLQNFVFYGAGEQIALASKLDWFYLMSVASWLLFMIYLSVFHGDKKLGKPTDKPEYSDAAYFSMIFTAGAAMGIYFYGVADSMGNQSISYSGNRFAKSPYLTQNEKDMHAFDLTMFEWGINCFAPYSLVGVMIGYQHYARGLPMTTRSLFYDYLGEYTWGWLGDLIDGYSLVSVMSGLLASLGISVNSLIQGFVALGWLDVDENKDSTYIQTIQSYMIVGIIACATVSVATGIDVGIKHLATLAMVGSTSLWIIIFCMENKPYVLNLMTQEIGSYFSHIFAWSFHTDAFAQLKIGDGAQIDQDAAAESWHITYFPLFFFSWSISWSPFVGTFYARVSKGRTVRECISYTLFVSFLYYLMWFSLFSGSGMRMQRRALELQNLGQVKYNDSDYFQASDRTHCYNPPLEPVNFCYDVNDESTCHVYINRQPGIDHVCTWTGNAAEAWFDYLRQFPELGYGLSIMSVICMFFFFITTSDSTSLVFDYLTSNGDNNHTWLQRCFWSIMQGTLTIILIWGAGEAGSALRTAQALCIIASIPNACMLSIACMNMVYSLNASTADYNQFRLPILGGVFDVVEGILSFGNFNPARGAPSTPSRAVWTTFFTSLLDPFYMVHHINQKAGQWDRNFSTIFTAVTWIGVIICIAIQVWPIAFMLYFWFVCNIAALRHSVRSKKNIRGNACEDFFVSALFYPQVLSQIAFEDVDSGLPIYSVQKEE